MKSTSHLNYICQAVVLSNQASTPVEAESKCLQILLKNIDAYEVARKEILKKPIIDVYKNFATELHAKINKELLPSGEMLLNLFQMWDKQLSDNYINKCWEDTYEEIKAFVSDDIDLPSDAEGLLALRELYDIHFPPNNPQQKLMELLSLSKQ